MKRDRWWTTLCVTFVLGFVGYVTAGEDGTKESPVAVPSPAKQPLEGAGVGAGTSQRTIYFSKHASVPDLVNLLGQHFDSESGVKLVAEPNSNLLSVRATSPAVLEEVLKTLALIDRPQQQVAFQVLIVEFNAKKSDGQEVGAVKPEVDTDELTDSAAAVLSKLAAWTRDGHVATVRKYQLTATENRSTELRLGEMKPMVTGFMSSAATGIATPTLSVRDMGTMIELKPRISETGEIATHISIQDSRLEAPELGIELARGVNGPIISRGILMSQMQTTLTIPDGKSRVTTGWQVEPKSNRISSVVVVSARIIDSNNPGRTVASEPDKAATPATPSDAPTRSTTEPRRFGEPAGNAPAGRSRFGGAPVSLSFALRDETFAMRMKLNDEQKKQLDQFRMDMYNALRGATREDLPRIVKEHEEKSVKILTDEQKKIWAERQAELNDSTKASPRPTPPSNAPPRSE